MDKVQAIVDLYNKYGMTDYIGEKVSQIEHAIQSAFYTEAFTEFGNLKGKLINVFEGISIHDINIDESIKNSIIVGGLLHDIGHLLLCDESSMSSMRKLGINGHEKIGSLYLQKVGFNKLVVYLVNSHILAKRYLLSKYPQYKNYLSKSCIQTLEQYGGLLCEDEIREFETHPFYKYALLVSISDDYAKIPNCKYNDISYYKDMIFSCINLHHSEVIL